jgi:hypothetical protein
MESGTARCSSVETTTPSGAFGVKVRQVPNIGEWLKPTRVLVVKNFFCQAEPKKFGIVVDKQCSR